MKKFEKREDNGNFLQASLLTRLLVPLALLLTVCWAGLTLVMARSTRHEIHEILDEQMVQTAVLLADHKWNSDSLVASERSGRHESWDYRIHYSVWDQNRNLILSDPRGARIEAFDLAAGTHFLQVGGEQYKLFVVNNPKSGLSAAAGYPTSLQHEILVEISEKIFAPWLMSLIIMLIISFTVLRGGLRPLSKLASEISSRGPKQLEYFDEEVPVEMKPLVAELNRLLARTKEGLEKERRFTADAAHELRTPLAAIKVQAEVLQLDSNSSDQSQQIQKVIAAVDRATRMVEQLLVLARLDAQAVGVEESHDTWSLRDLVQEQIELLSAKVKERRVIFELRELHPEVTWTCNRILMGILIRNLIENSLHYSGESSKISLLMDENSFELQDEGPGIPESQMARIKERFYRPEGQRQSGTGLGLSIVERIAEISGFDVILENRKPRGLSVVVRKMILPNR